jgi:hypothetical protein
MARSWRTPAVLLLLAATALQGAHAELSAADALFSYASAATLAVSARAGIEAATHESQRAAMARVVQAKLLGVRQGKAEAKAPSSDGSDDPMAACMSTVPCFAQMMGIVSNQTMILAFLNITDVKQCPMSASAVNACYGVRACPRRHVPADGGSLCSRRRPPPRQGPHTHNTNARRPCGLMLGVRTVCVHHTTGNAVDLRSCCPGCHVLRLFFLF